MKMKYESEDDLLVLLQQLSCNSMVFRALGRAKDDQVIDLFCNALKSKDKNILRLSALNIQFMTQLSGVKEERYIKPLIEILDDEVPSVRLKAVEALITLDPKDEVETFYRILADDDLDVRTCAGEALENLRNLSFDELCKEISDKRQPYRMMAVNALEKLDDDRTADLLIKALKDENAAVRSNAATAFGDSKSDRKVIEALCEALFDDDVNVRRGAARSLSRVEAEDAFENLMKALDDEDEEVKENTIEALGAIKDARCLEKLSKILNDERWEIGAKAAYAMNIVSNKSCDDLCSDLLNEKDCIRIAAAHRLSDLEENKAKKYLVDALKDNCPQVRMWAILALRSYEDDQLVDLFIGLLNDESPEVREVAIRGLFKSTDDQAVNAIIKALCNDDNAEVRADAARYLEDIDNKRAVTALVDALGDEDRGVRIFASSALYETDAKYEQQLIKALDSEDQQIKVMVALILATKGTAGSKKAVSSIESDLVKTVAMAIANVAEKLRIEDAANS